MPAVSPISGEDPYTIDDVRADLALIAEEVNPLLHDNVLALRDLAEAMEVYATGALIPDPSPITYEIVRDGDHVTLCAYAPITSDVECFVMADAASLSVEGCIRLASFHLTNNIESFGDTALWPQVATFQLNEVEDIGLAVNHIYEQCLLRTVRAFLQILRHPSLMSP